MENRVDLHIHTTASDGTCSPIEVVEQAIELGLSTIAITDHDSINGAMEATRYAEGKNIKVITGVELTAMSDIKQDVGMKWPRGEDMTGDESEGRLYVNGRSDLSETHILGYNLDWDKELIDTLTWLSMLRNNRIDMMAEKLAQDYPEVSIQEIYSIFPGATLTRSNLAVYLVKLKIASSISDAFDRFLNEESKYYVHKLKLTDEGAISIIKFCGGLPVLAHPTLCKNPDRIPLTDEEYERLFDNVTEMGIMGIEAIYPKNREKDQERFTAMAKERGLFITGGSDFHGAAKPEVFLGRGIDNNLFVPEEVLDHFVSEY